LLIKQQKTLGGYFILPHPVYTPFVFTVDVPLPTLKVLSRRCMAALCIALQHEVQYSMARHGAL